jgi:hypothetical protein
MGAVEDRRTPAIARVREHPALFPVLLGLLVVVNAAWVAHWAAHMHGLAIFDEKFAVEGARWLHGGLGRLFGATNFNGRGIERLLAASFVPAIWFFKSTATQFKFDHAFMALLFALQAVPAFLLARDLLAPRLWALTAAALAVFGPWCVFGTVFVNNAPAACFAAFALWTAMRAIVRRSSGWYALTLLLLTLATFERVSTLVLVGAVIGAAVVHTLMTTRRWRDLVSAWPVVAGAILVLGFVATGHVHTLIGGYPTHVHLTAGLVGNRLLTTFAHLAAGSALVGLVVGGGWVLHQALRPSSPDANAFAWLALGWFAALSYVNLASGTDERYELMLFVPLAVAMVVALARREITLVPTVFIAALAWFALRKHGDIGPLALTSDYLTWPSREWLTRVLLTKAQYPGGLSHGTTLNLIGFALVALSVGLALLRGRWQSWLGIAVCVFALVYGVAGSAWAMRKLSDTQSPQTPFSAMSFIDRLTGGEQTDAFANTAEVDPGVPHTWDLVQYYNGSVRRTISIGSPVYGLCCSGFGDDQVAMVDQATGAVTSNTPLPKYVATVPQWLPAAFATQLVSVSPAYDRPVRLERLRQPPLAAWTSSGFDNWGWVRPKQKAQLRVYPAGTPTPACLRLTLQAPALPSGATRWRITGRGVRASGLLTERQTVRSDVRLSGNRPIDLSVTAGRVAPDPTTGQPGLVGISDLRLLRCGAPDGR